MKVGQAAVAYLASLGIRRVYGVPGEDHLRLLHEIEAGGIEYVVARDESAACVMATVEAQLTGLPGVALVTLAPGLTNAMNGIANAFMDGIPLLVLAGQHDPERFPLVVRQALDGRALVAPLTKWSAVAGTRVHQVLAKAIDTALAPRPGPVYLELREDVARLEATDHAANWPSLFAGRAATPQPAAEESLARLIDALRRATKPVLLVGGVARNPRVAEAAARFCTTLGVPALTTPSAKGALPDDHPWQAGTFLNANLEESLLNGADLIIALGLSAADFFNRPWPYTSTAVAIEADATNTQRFVPVAFQVVGDPAATLAYVSATLEARYRWKSDDVASYRARVADAFAAPDTSLTIPGAIRALSDALPPDTLLAVDAGFGKPLATLLWPSSVPATCFSSFGLSTMGYAIPAATALKLNHPKRTVVGLLGDGSLLMRAAEIGVAAQLRIAPIFVVWVDAALSQIEVKQQRQDLGTVGTQFPLPSCERIAAAFGANGRDVSTIAGLRVAVSDALTSQLPSLIGVRIDRSLHRDWYELLRG